MLRVFQLAAALLVPACAAQTQSAPAASLEPTDLITLQVCEGILHLFQDSPDAVWPGFDLSSRPFVVYRPNRWALLLGHRGEAPGFGAYPSTWPELGFPTFFHAGRYENLSGQLVFGFPVGDKNAVAVGIPDDLSAVPGAGNVPAEAFLLGYIVHESFHQYQMEHFGNVESPSEERYPILDVENSALAALEMHVLLAAVAEAERGDQQACAEAAGQFVAVRAERWKRADEFVKTFEPGLELWEGTAKYVEVRAIALTGALRYTARVPTEKPLPELLIGLTVPRLLRMNFEERLTEGAIAPDDMPRNRVYPVAATQCFLLDVLGIDWRVAAQRAAADFSYLALLHERLALDERELERLLARVKERHGYDQLKTVTVAQIEKYHAGFEEALATFERQTGMRVEVTLPTNGLARSRTSFGRKWLMDGGRRSLCRNHVYVLRRSDTRLEIRESMVLELNDWEARKRTAISFAHGAVEVTVDGKPVALDDGLEARFERVSLHADDVSVESSAPGTIRRLNGRLLVDLAPRSGRTAPTKPTEPSAPAGNGQP
jgi:hypothetical protein